MVRRWSLRAARGGLSLRAAVRAVVGLVEGLPLPCLLAVLQVLTLGCCTYTCGRLAVSSAHIITTQPAILTASVVTPPGSGALVGVHCVDGFWAWVALLVGVSSSRT